MFSSPRVKPIFDIHWVMRTVLCFITVLCLCAPLSASDDRPNRVDPVFRREYVRPQALAVAPDGRAAASLEEDGTLRIYSTRGEELLAQRFSGATYMALSDSAERIVLAGTRGGSWWIRIIDTSGHTIWNQPEGGQVFGVTITSAGDMAFASLSGARMYIFELGERPRWRRIRTDSQLRDIRYMASVNSLLVTTSDPPGFGLASMEGRNVWWEKRPSGQFRLESAAQGSLVLTIISVLSPKPEVAITIYTASGRSLHSIQLEGYEPRAAITSDGNNIAVGYRRKLQHRDKSVMERRIALYEVGGRRLWEQGGLFFKPVLAGILERPLGVMVAEDYSLLSALNRHGRLAWRGPALRDELVRITHDEGWLLGWVEFRDGGLELWRLNRP